LPVLEAMACGLPVITSLAAGVSEIIRTREEGFVLRDPRDSRELASAVETLATDANLREQMGKQARRTAEQYTWDRNASETMEFLRDASLAKRKNVSS
jgi:glycosyltransferase involved in cell wall biosynthesis